MKNKILLSQNYSDFCKKTFDMPESDFSEYYKSIIKEYSAENPNIIKRIEAGINKWIDWYTTIINFQNENDEIKVEIETSTVSLEKYPMLNTSFRTHVNKAFFNKQLEIIKQMEI